MDKKSKMSVIKEGYWFWLSHLLIIIQFKYGKVQCWDWYMLLYSQASITRNTSVTVTKIRIELIRHKLIYICHQTVIRWVLLLLHLVKWGYVAAVDIQIHVCCEINWFPFTCAPLIECSIILSRKWLYSNKMKGKHVQLSKRVQALPLKRSWCWVAKGSGPVKNTSCITEMTMEQR